MQLAFSILAILLYLVCAIQIWRRLNAQRISGAVGCGRNIALLWIAAIALHGTVLYMNIATTGGISLGSSQAISLVGWSMAFLVLIALHTRPVEGLGLILLPFAALTVIGELLFPGKHILPQSPGELLAIHIFISLIATSLFVIAALETLLLWYQDRRLKNHRPGGWMRVLPPLQHTESLLFQTIGLGFVLLTIALITGLVFINQFFSMASPQRTLLFIAAWVIFGGLLLARWRLGWRGRIAIRWTLSGFVILVIAYFSALLFRLFSI